MLFNVIYFYVSDLFSGNTLTLVNILLEKALVMKLADCIVLQFIHLGKVQNQVIFIYLQFKEILVLSSERQLCSKEQNLLFS